MLKTDNGSSLVFVEIKTNYAQKAFHHAKSAIYWRRCNREIKCHYRTLVKFISTILAKSKV